MDTVYNLPNNITNRNIWKFLIGKKSLSELIKDVPDVYHNWIKLQIDNFNQMYVITESFAKVMYYMDVNPQNGMTKKEVAMKILSQPKNLQPLYFLFYNEKNYSPYIWRLLYPKHYKPSIINEKL